MNNLYPIEIQCNRIRLIRQVSNKMGIPLFINARTDVNINGKEFETPESKFKEVVKRGLAYKDAGADCFFPIAIRKEEEIKNLIAQLKLPLNILTIPGFPDLKKLSELGIARISLGPSFLKIAIRAMKELAVHLKEYDGISAMIDNEVTTDYLKKLVKKKNN